MNVICKYVICGDTFCGLILKDDHFNLIYEFFTADIAV